MRTESVRRDLDMSEGVAEARWLEIAALRCRVHLFL